MSDGPILVTGAGGFVCSEVALALHRAGHDVVALDQRFDAATTERLRALNRIEGDLPEALARGPETVAAVIHGAAITASPERLGLSQAGHIRRNTDLLTATLDHTRSTGAKRFLFVSSMGVFEPDDSPTPGGKVTEATRPTATCAYCAAKHAGELLTHAAAEPGFETASLRLGNIVGPHEAVRETRQHLCLVNRMIAEARASGVITVQTPDALREWAWLPDQADGIARLLTSDDFSTHAAVLHAGSPPALSDLDLARAIAERVPGTTVRLAQPPHAAIRPPMASDHDSALNRTHWTPMDAALDQLIPMEATP
ncbi:NAD-dependent epimerase/dehydratase family protein [Gymnodinialimonas ceratoperidinii]|uniref:NAD(P)-dependent oxidoreductase n=1 Tax=Gymnodinialimonas ceratoperidinii TaxID=2856823 RepID=A0A8F6YDB8_9RHOB|nr:NAD(P)-dependent oxidoreductase [Gymnodinialimonas ceratoperidinii]QXT40270.1 NAD(P)-dependent oxidoreductase [Gymnodinialimonas ceratoperidinii]